MKRLAARTLALFAAAFALAAGPLRAQSAATNIDLEVTPGGLLRTGAQVGPDDLAQRDGFEVFDARLSFAGKVGIVFDYFVQGEFDDVQNRFRLLDASLTLPLRGNLLKLTFGQFKAPFGHEELENKKDIQFIERSQVTNALAPDRQVGLQLSGAALDGRLSYWGGLSNGNGRDVENDNDSFLYAVRAQFNTIGDVEFYEDLVVQVGASFAVSTDSSIDVLPVPVPTNASSDQSLESFASFRGQRVLWGLDLMASYRGLFLNGEYLRADFDVDPVSVPLGTLIVNGSPVPLPSTNLSAEGFYVEGGYSLWGAVEALVRYDQFDPALGPPSAPDRSKFLILGLNLYPGFYAKIGIQYAFGIDDTRLGPGLADNQFILSTQVGF